MEKELNDILQQIRICGLNPTELIPDTKLHRFASDDKDKKKSGWYCGFQNANRFGEAYYIFLYGDHHTGDTHTAFSGAKMDKQDRERAKEQTRKAQREAHKEKIKLNEEASRLANERFNSLTDNLGYNEYLEKKGLTELHGARIDGFDLVIPMRDIDGNLKNIETISLGGKIKKGLFGGQRTELFHRIGEIKDTIYLCEGFSTAATVHTATDECAIAAFNAGNLPVVATILAKRYSDKILIVCGDNDAFTENNIGAIKAEQAAKEGGGKFILPIFKDPQPNLTDFNDLFLAEGIETVHAQIEAIRPTAPVEAFDESYIVDHPYPDETERGNRRGSIRNVVELLRRLRVVVRYNVISKEEEILIPNHTFSMDNQANASLAHILSWCEITKISTGNLTTYLTAIADSNPYNPVLTWITSKSWDGLTRLPDIYETLRAKKEKTDPSVRHLKERLMLTWLVSGVAALCEPDGVSTQGMLVLQGGQNVGKTSWFKSLVPKDLEVRADGMTLKPDDRDSVFQVISKWLVELGELDATFRKADIAQLKAFLTKDRDILRRSHARKESNYARRTFFGASVNDLDFLKDPTGNRRFWTVECEGVDFNHGIDTQQLWAEVLTLYQKGTPWILTEDEIALLNKHNEKFQSTDPIEDRIMTTYDWEHGFGPTWKGATQVCMELGIDHPNKQQKDAAGRILRKLRPEEPTQNREVNGIRQYLVPARHLV